MKNVQLSPLSLIVGSAFTAGLFLLSSMQNAAGPSISADAREFLSHIDMVDGLDDGGLPTRIAQFDLSMQVRGALDAMMVRAVDHDGAVRVGMLGPSGGLMIKPGKGVDKRTMIALVCDEAGNKIRTYGKTTMVFSDIEAKPRVSLVAGDYMSGLNLTGGTGSGGGRVTPIDIGQSYDPETNKEIVLFRIGKDGPSFFGPPK